MTDSPFYALPNMDDPMAAWKHALDAWGAALAPLAEQGKAHVNVNDRRFQGEEWDHPVFDLMRQGYTLMAQQMEEMVDAADLAPEDKRKMRFAMRNLVEAMSPANSLFTNPKALNKAIETKGESLVKGMEHLLADVQRGQMTHSAPGAFELGRNIAATPGKVIWQSRMYELIHYAPTTPSVAKIPLLVFPPWINRFYILDLTAEKSFIKWCTDQGLSFFIVSWKSADTTMADVVWDDYIAAQIEAIEVVRSLLNVPHVHTIGYCVGGTTLAATLAIMAAQGDADKVKSATFFTAQVDFEKAGELLSFIDDHQLQMVEALSGDGFLDGRFMAQTFNMLRGRDLIWSTVEKNYLLGEDYPSFDLLHWNGDVTNLPAKWHRDYLKDLYRDNKLVQPGALKALDTPIDLTQITTPCYVQAGKEDHIAPAESVWKIRDHVNGPVTFILAGSGHIAGVVNPPALGKYQYWTNDADGITSLPDFIEGSTETKGSWWPHWRAWIAVQSDDQVEAAGAYVPGEGALKAIADAPGDYVRGR
jgi:polyhydroxyalkanoate synthase subunit PhaC